MPDKPGAVTGKHGRLDAVLERFHSSADDTRHTTGGRRRKEKKRLSSTDGRSRRGLGRERQWPAKVTQDLWDAADDACDRFDLTKAELTDRAIRSYIRQLEEGTAE